MIQLPLDDDKQKSIGDKAECRARVRYLEDHKLELPGPDDQLSVPNMQAWCDNYLKEDGWKVGGRHGSKAECDALAFKARKEAAAKTAWRIEGTLREFPTFPPVNLWFDYPIHHIENEGGFLQDIDPEEVKPMWQRASEARKRKNEKRGNKVARERILEHANLAFGGEDVKLTDLADKWGMTEMGARKWIKGKVGSQHFYIKDGCVFAKESGETKH
jgi:hypothetical protein